MKFLEHSVEVKDLIGKKIKLKEIEQSKGKKASVYDIGNDIFYRYEVIFRKDENSIYKIAIFGPSSPELNVTEITKDIFSRYKILNGSKIGEYCKSCPLFQEEFKERDKFLKNLGM